MKARMLAIREEIFDLSAQTSFLSRSYLRSKGMKLGRASLLMSVAALLIALLLALAARDSVVYALPPSPPQTDSTVRVSISSSGVQGSAISNILSTSADGMLVAFASAATNLVLGDTNDETDIFVHNRQTGDTTRVSVNSSGVETNGLSSVPSISGDGRFVAFQSEATNLVLNDNNGSADIFVHDLKTGQTTRVSVDSNGVEGNGNSSRPSISRDGRYVAFESSASNLIPSDTNGFQDIFVHDRQTGDTTRVSVESSALQLPGNNNSFDPDISEDGRFVAFESFATNLVPGDTNGFRDIFVHDRQTGDTTRVSVDSSDVETDNESFGASISADGRYVAFTSNATNLVPDDTNADLDVFLHDRQTGDTIRVSVDYSGMEVQGNSTRPSISASGRFVAFHAFPSLVPEDNNNSFDIYVRDLDNGLITRVSVDSSGVEANNHSSIASISGDGRFVAFYSDATNLVSDDTNGDGDVFTSVNVLHPGMTCNNLKPNIIGTPRTDFLMGTSGDDVILDLGGASSTSANVILGMDGDDTICGSGSDDIIDGGAGSDWIFGGRGNDEINGGLGNDTILGGRDSDLLLGAEGDDLIDGAEGDDQASGGDGNDLIFGGDGLDILFGDLGDDILSGDAGDDSLNCGGGTDIADGGQDTDSSDASCEITTDVP